MNATERSPGGESIRVAYFPMHPADDRATDTFCVIPSERLTDRGIGGHVFAPSSPETRRRFYRGKRRGWQFTVFIYWYLLVLPRRLLQLTRLRRYDLVLVQRSMFRWSSPPVLEWITARLLRVPIVYHLDDGIWLEARRSWSEARCRLAVTVITGNADVAAFVREAGGTVTGIEYAIDVNSYPVKSRKDGGPVVIGYTGIDPAPHLGPIAHALRTVCDETGARIRVVGGLRRPEMPELDPVLDWVAWDNDDKFSWARDFDIGVMPITDTPLHRAKDSMKVKEYMAAGLPQVTSPVGHNLKLITDGVEGYFASTGGEWEDRLNRLVGDPELRAAMGARGRESALERFNLPRLLDDLAALYRKVVAEG